MSQSFRLYRLQQIDSQLDRAHARLEEIRLALLDTQELQQAQSTAQQAENYLNNDRKKLRQAEQAVKDQRVKIETTEAALYGGKVRNPKELQDLQNESAALKRFLAVLEERQLEAMFAEEKAAESAREAKISLELVQARHNNHQVELQEERNRQIGEIPRLEEERAAALGAIPANELSLYEALRKSRKGLAVTLVKNKACTACGTTLNAMLFDAALNSEQINRCDGCGRILYVS
jgi:uncharacterized protein